MKRWWCNHSWIAYICPELVQTREVRASCHNERIIAPTHVQTCLPIPLRCRQSNYSSPVHCPAWKQRKLHRHCPYGFLARRHHQGECAVDAGKDWRWVQRARSGHFWYIHCYHAYITSHHHNLYVFPTNLNNYQEMLTSRWHAMRTTCGMCCSKC